MKNRDFFESVLTEKEGPKLPLKPQNQCLPDVGEENPQDVCPAHPGLSLSASCAPHLAERRGEGCWLLRGA